MTPEIYLSAGGLVITGVIWLVRLEGKVKAQEKLIESQDKRLGLLQEKHENLDSRIVNELTRIREALARMEGRLGYSGGHGPDA